MSPGDDSMHASGSSTDTFEPQRTASPDADVLPLGLDHGHDALSTSGVVLTGGLCCVVRSHPMLRRDLGTRLVRCPV